MVIKTLLKTWNRKISGFFHFGGTGGVIPDVMLKNTILGIRNDKDEVLEEAIRLAKENEAKARVLR